MNKSLKKSFKKGILDAAIPPKITPKGLKSKLIKLLPKPLKPSKYTPPKPVPKPRKQKAEPPVPLPKSDLYPRPISKKVEKVIGEITPYYKPEAIREFQKILCDKKSQN